MKVVVALILGLCVSNAFAWDYQSQAEAKFKAMTAEEAYASDFKKEIMNIQMPGTSTWVKPTGLCMDGGTVRTVNPIGFCVEWTGKNDDGKTVTVDNYWDAKETFGSTSDKCSAQVFKIFSTPINYPASKCAKWSAKTSEDGVKYFTSKSKAEDYGNNVTCVETVNYTAKFPTTFAVKFYRNSLDDSRYLGTHTYGIGRCNGGSTPEVEAF
jgi:hypothetical protein